MLERFQIISSCFISVACEDEPSRKLLRRIMHELAEVHAPVRKIMTRTRIDNPVFFMLSPDREIMKCSQLCDK